MRQIVHAHYEWDIDALHIQDIISKLTAIAKMLPPLNFVGSDLCCAEHIDGIATKRSVIALMLEGNYWSLYQVKFQL